MGRSPQTSDDVTCSVTSTDGKPMRADAARNRTRLIEIAGEAFAEHGVETSLEEIARRAGVGIGTLYRHFPTRADLIEAVYRLEIDRLCDDVEELQRANTADAALDIWMARFVAHVQRKRGMSDALHAAMRNQPELFADMRQRVRDTLQSLLTNAAAAGHIREGIEPDDMMRLMSGVCMATETSTLPGQTERMLGLVFDGLRFGASA